MSTEQPAAVQEALPMHVAPVLPQASGGEWRQELLFSVPIDHPEVQRLQGRYKK